MELKDLMSISGYPGLFRFISQGRNAIIVESLKDGKRMSAYSTSRISSLEEISVYTEQGEISLAEVLKRMHGYSEGKEAPRHKSPPEELKGYFEKVLPEYDRERVYVSDIKKIISWYNILLQHDLPGLIEKAEEKEKQSADDQGDRGEEVGTAGKKPESKPGSKPESKPESKPVDKAGTKPETKAGTRAATKPGTKAGTKPGAKAGTNIKSGVRKQGRGQ